MFVRVFLLFLALAAAWLPTAHASDLVLVLSDRGGVYGEFAEALKKSLADSSWRVVATVTPDRLAAEPALRNAELWLTVGSEATRQSLPQALNVGVMATLLPRSAFEAMSPESAYRGKGRLQALVLDQPLERQVQLIQTLFPGRKKVGLLAGPEGRARLAAAQQALRAGGLTPESEEAADDSAVVPAANRLLGRADVLLALPDGLVYSRTNVPPVLLASYRHQRPVVGYSAAFVNAGAIAGIYSTPAQIARQVAEILASGRRPAATILYPNRFTLSYNRQVAQSLGIELPDERGVLRALENKGED